MPIKGAHVDRRCARCDASLVASMVVDYRSQIAREWGRAVASSVPDALQRILLADLESSLEAGGSASDEAQDES